MDSRKYWKDKILINGTQSFVTNQSQRYNGTGSMVDSQRVEMEGDSATGVLCSSTSGTGALTSVETEISEGSSRCHCLGFSLLCNLNALTTFPHNFFGGSSDR